MAKIKKEQIEDGAFSGGFIYPSDYTGTDTEKIQKAVDDAPTFELPVKIPKKDVSNTPWDIEDAILIGSNTTIYIDGAILQLTDTSRDNIFRTENCGFGIVAPFTVLENIHIIGLNGAILQGAENPRATGDAAKTLTSTTVSSGSLSYGTDAGVGGETQTGDWRNIMMLFAYTNNYSVKGLKFVQSHMWTVSNEECTNGRFNNLEFDNTIEIIVPAVGTVYTRNKDGCNFRMGCSDMIADDFIGHSDDDTVACTVADTSDLAGVYGTYEVTGNVYAGVSDDIHDITIRNIFMSTENHVVRLLAGNGGNVYNINIDNVTDTIDSSSLIAVIRLGDSGAIVGGANVLGTLYNVSINNVRNNNATYCVLVAGSVSESNISNIIDEKANANTPISFLAGNVGARNVQLTNIFKDGVSNDLTSFLDTTTTGEYQGVVIENDILTIKDEVRDLLGVPIAVSPISPREIKYFWSGTDAELALLTQDIYTVYITESGATQPALPTGILFEDDFAGVTIDVAKWTVNNPNTSSIEFTQNSKLLANIKSNAVTTFGQDNMLGVTGWDISSQDIFMTFDILNPNQSESDIWLIGFTPTALQTDTNNRIQIIRKTTAGQISLSVVRAGAGDYALDVSLDISTIKRLGISVTSTTITFYSWNGSSWDNIGSTTNLFGTVTMYPTIMSTDSTSATVHSIEYTRLYVNDGFHSTEIPV